MVSTPCGVAQLSGPPLETFEDQATEAAALHVGRDAHAFDLGAAGAGLPQGSHRDEPAFEQAHNEVATLLEVHLGNRVQVVIPGAGACVCSGVVQRLLVQRPDRVVVGVLIATDPQSRAHEQRMAGAADPRGYSESVRSASSPAGW